MDMVNTRGYCGIGVYNLKSDVNYGTLFRSALAFGVDLLFLIGKRFKRQALDTTRAERHIPLFEFPTIEDFLAHIPFDCPLVGVEITDGAEDIASFCHPQRCVYLVGPEDGSLPPALLTKCQAVVEIRTRFCLNVAVAGTIVLYDRQVKSLKGKD